SGNYNALTLTAVTGATSYDIYRTVAPTSPSTTGKIGNTTALTFNDPGLAGDATTPPATNTTGDILWTTDNAADIGTSGANRPRNIYVGNQVTTASLSITNNYSAHQFLGNSSSSSNPPAAVQPAFSDITGTITPSTQMPTSGVTAGSYTSTNLTVNAQGLVTSASNGSSVAI